jgi:hypothetical protein
MFRDSHSHQPHTSAGIQMRAALGMAIAKTRGLRLLNRQSCLYEICADDQT